MTGWPSNQPETEPEKLPEITEEQRNAIIQNWLTEKAALEQHKQDEMASRTTVSKMLFPNPSKGTQRFQLGQGYAVKLVQTYTYKLGDDQAIDESGIKIPVWNQVDAIMTKISEEFGVKGQLLADRLIRWKPELVEKEYLLLDIQDEDQRKIRDLIDSILEVKPGSPQLTFETPKPQ